MVRQLVYRNVVDENDQIVAVLKDNGDCIIETIEDSFDKITAQIQHINNEYIITIKTNVIDDYIEVENSAIIRTDNEGVGLYRSNVYIYQITVVDDLGKHLVYVDE